LNFAATAASDNLCSHNYKLLPTQALRRAVLSLPDKVVKLTCLCFFAKKQKGVSVSGITVTPSQNLTRLKIKAKPVIRL
jgi:hypothetical protein